MQKKNILINLKRFDVPTELGGICTETSPSKWVKKSIDEIIKFGWAKSDKINLVIFVPDILLEAALNQVSSYPASEVTSLSIGSQSCHYDDVSQGGNFGAFTSFSLASSQSVFGCTSSLIGHCEERKYLEFVMSQSSSDAPQELDARVESINSLINQKARCALNQKMSAVICIGEKSEERGNGNIIEQVNNAKAAIEKQILGSLNGFDKTSLVKVTLAYEPVWAIGPGKTPPDKEYIQSISHFIKDVVLKNFGHTVPVVYGGGLKFDNAAMLASIDSLDGGLIALTNFTHPIGFYPGELDRILREYLQV